MKKTLTIIGILGFAILFAQTAANLTEFKENISEQKAEAKSKLKSYRYDGSKITYFNFKTYQQVKEVEIYLFNETDYRFSFNGKSLPNDITVKIYDQDKTVEDRVLLKEFTGLQGNNLTIESTELNDAYLAKKNEKTRLKRVYIDYVIPNIPGAQNKQPTMKERGAIILVMGYKN
jgi:actin-related protein